MTKFQLAASLFSPVDAPVRVTVSGWTGKVVQIQAESGSGSTFNVCLSMPNGLPGGSSRHVVFVKTVD